MALWTPSHLQRPGLVRSFAAHIHVVFSMEHVQHRHNQQSHYAKCKQFSGVADAHDANTKGFGGLGCAVLPAIDPCGTRSVVLVVSVIVVQRYSMVKWCSMVN